MTMSNKKNILARLDGMIQAVGKTASAKTASPGGDLRSDNGTQKPETGARMAENKADAAKSTKAMIDGGAAVNPVNGSVTSSTEGAAAAAIDGQSGSTGGVLACKGEAPNEKGGSIKSASIADQLRKAASDLETSAVAPVAAPSPAPAVKVASVDALATVRGILGKTADAKSALSGLEKHIAGLVKSGSIKVAGDAGAMDEHGAADAGVKDLIAKLESGEIPEEQAEQILVSALQSGDISKDELAQAMNELHAPGAAGDPAAQPAPQGDAGAPPADPAADPAMSQKVAMADIGEDDERYLAKLAVLYPSEQKLAKEACIKFAEELIKAAAAPGGDLDADNGTKKVEEAPTAAKPPKDLGATEAKVDDNVAHDLPAAKTAATKVADAGGMPVAPPAADPSAAAGAPPADPMSAAGIAPQGADQEAALDALLQQIGMTRDQLKAMLDQPAPAPADPAMQKAASYVTKVVAAMMSKNAAFELATLAAK
jgi:hypothetical protein